MRGGAEDPGDFLHIEARFFATHFDDVTSIRWRRQGDLFVAQGRRSLTLDEVRTLRGTLLGAPLGGQLQLEQLGVTPESARAAKMDYAVVREKAVELATQGGYFANEMYGIPKATFIVRMEGLTAIAKGSPRPYMLPWTLNGSRSYSPTVPLAVAAVLDAKDAGYDFLDGREFWPSRFWTKARPVIEREAEP